MRLETVNLLCRPAMGPLHMHAVSAITATCCSHQLLWTCDTACSAFGRSRQNNYCTAGGIHAIVLRSTQTARLIDMHLRKSKVLLRPQIAPVSLESLSCSASTIAVSAPRLLREAHPLLELLKEGRGLHRLAGLAGDVVDGLLPVLHAGHVIFQARHLLPTLCAVIPQQICNHRNIAIRTANSSKVKRPVFRTCTGPKHILQNWCQDLVHEGAWIR